nr:hypothetical protein [Tanacetum cinerariifolium]
LKDLEGESDREEVPETNFEEVPDQSIFNGNSVRKNDVYFEDPFGIYEVLNKKRDGKNIDDKHEDSLKYPHGFTPNEEGDVLVEKVDNSSDENRVNEGKKEGLSEGQHVHERVDVSNDTHESTCSGHFKKSEVPYKGMTCWVRAIEEPGWVPYFEEDGEEGYDVNDGSHEDDMYGGVSEKLKDLEGESDREEVPETNFEEVPDQSIFNGNSVRKNDVYFEDPFGIYEVLNKKRDGKNIDDKHEDSLKYPH